MRVYGAFEAKTHFSQLLRDIEEGESVTITRRGKPIAVITPVREQSPRAGLADRMKKLRKGVTFGSDLTIRDLINEGRR